jgi:hypothetical protein
MYAQLLSREEYFHANAAAVSNCFAEQLAQKSLRLRRTFGLTIGTSDFGVGSDNPEVHCDFRIFAEVR